MAFCLFTYLNVVNNYVKHAEIWINSVVSGYRLHGILRVKSSRASGRQVNATKMQTQTVAELLHKTA